MFVNYHTLSSEAKIWIYPSSRKFYQQEIERLQNQLQNFVENWKKEDKNFKGSYQLLHNRFIVFLVEKSICPLNFEDVNKQVQFILQLQNEYKVNLLDKMNVCFKQGNYIQYKDLKAFKKLLKNKAVSNKTIVFNHLINTKEELENYWEVPITESWYNQFIK